MQISNNYYEQNNYLQSQPSWTPRPRYQHHSDNNTLGFSNNPYHHRKPLEVVVPSVRLPFIPEPRQYTYPTKPTLERKNSKTEVTTTDGVIDQLIPEKTLDGPQSSNKYCEGCHKELGGQVLTTATNKLWHHTCFKCQHCHIHLEHLEYFEQDGKPYCALDFHEHFSSRCDYCKTPIEADCKIVALGKSYHVGHAFCRECGDPFKENDRIIEKDGYGYCEDDFNKLFAKACKGCGECITEGFIKALGGEWHPSCFVCVDCGSQFTSLTFKLKGGKPHCGKKDCGSSPNQKKESSDEKICHGCEKPIKGRCHTAFGHNYHPIHFQCTHCEKVLSARLTGIKRNKHLSKHKGILILFVGLFEEDGHGEIVCKACVRKVNISLH